MELLPYQQQVLNDLADFLRYVERRGNLKEAFADYWLDRGLARPEPYRDIIPQVPHVCIKVPTGGGKTFIAANAMKTIFDALTIYMRDEPQTVVWLVPSNAILDQTIKSLGNPQHPYRRKVDTLFNGRVAVYSKEDLLQGAGFNATSVREQLNILILSYASFRTSNKDGRKAFQENSNLNTFVHQMKSGDVLSDTDESALVNVIRSMNPVCIVDESHNTGSTLSKEMLVNFNPSLILDLTATPRKESNIISYVDAAQLKTYNMVKLPVIVYNHHSSKEVISNAIQLRNNLEIQAVTEQKGGGDYIRPIVLFQAESNTGQEDKTTFEEIKKRLVKLGIAEEEIAIKTANINELKNEDLLSAGCPIRYIITINALKEGWDCPFAYILATIANRQSQVDVEQIVGRVLRQPYARRQHNNLLNNSYVLASSANFITTLDKIVAGLNQAGFSKKDMRAKDLAELAGPNPNPALEQKPAGLFDTPQVGERTAIDEATSTNNNSVEWPESLPDLSVRSGENIPDVLQDIIEQAKKETRAYEEQVSRSSFEKISEEVRDKMNDFGMVAHSAEQAKKLCLPQFFMKIPNMSLFGEDTFLFNKEELLKDFRLSQADSSMDFSVMEDEAYRVDLEEVGEHDYKPRFWKLQHSTRERLMEYLIALPPESQKKAVATRLCDLVGNMYPIADQEVKKYVQRILDDMNVEQINDCLEREFSYRNKIKAKIKELATDHAETVFYQWLAADKIMTQESFKLPESIHPVETAPAIPASLYASEGKLNSWEVKVINEIANLDNIAFWHRIEERKGFFINGFINHYPDFLVQTKNGKTLIVETKGDDRDNSDSVRKLKLGEGWANKAGNDFRYFMVFDTNAIAGAYNLDDFLKVVGGLG
jgi:type III restriction enzyme